MPARNTRGAMSDLHKSAGQLPCAKYECELLSFSFKKRNENDNNSHLESEMRTIQEMK